MRQCLNKHRILRSDAAIDGFDNTPHFPLRSRRGHDFGGGHHTPRPDRPTGGRAGVVERLGQHAADGHALLPVTYRASSVRSVTSISRSITSAGDSCGKLLSTTSLA